MSVVYRETTGSCIQNNVAVLTLHGMKKRTLKPLKVKALIFFFSLLIKLTVGVKELSN